MDVDGLQHKDTMSTKSFQKIAKICSVICMYDIGAFDTGTY